MIRLWPRSLYGRNALILSVTVFLSVSLSLVSIYALIGNAQVNRFSGIAAQLVNTISAASYEVTPDVRDALLIDIDESPYLQVLPLGVAPKIGRSRESAGEKLFMQRFIDHLDYQNEMEWRVDENRTLWLRLRIGEEYYWIAAESRTSWTPMGWLVFIMIVIVCVVTMIGIIATRHISRPLATLKRETDRLSLGSESKMTEVTGPSEIKSLADSFVRMSARLKDAESVRAETLAELSHDLRTPLARLRLAVEMMSESGELKESATRQVQQIDQLIGQFLDYARGSETERKSEFCLSTLVQDIADQFEVEVDLTLNVLVQGQRENIRRAIINLVENALKYGAAPIRMRLSKTTAFVVIDVIDMGDGFDPKDTDEMLTSFKRGKHASDISGSGLGLAIVDRIAAAHDGTISFAKQTPRGFCASVKLSLNSSQ